MVKRVIQTVVLTVLTTLIVTGCGRRVAKEPSQDLNLLATGPNRAALSVPRPWVTSAFDATGGMALWTRARQLDFDAVVTASRRDGSFYLTEHEFDVYPWSDAIQVAAMESGGRMVWRVVGGQYRWVDGNDRADVSPVSAFYRDYAEAVLQIATAPARMLSRNVALTRRPNRVQIGGQWYDPIEAKFQGRAIVSKEKGREKTVVIAPYWTDGIYFQNQDRLVADVVWLANPTAQKFLLVRGYDYAPLTKGGVLVPTKIEIFQSGPEALPGPRLALIDVTQ